jgi:hypothetical protein
MVERAVELGMPALAARLRMSPSEITLPILIDGEDVVLEYEATGQELQREAVYFLGVNRLARGAENFTQLGGESGLVGFAGVEDFDGPCAATGGFDGEEFGSGGVVATGGEQRVE